MKKLLAPAVIIIVTIALDQITKYWALATLSYGQPVEALGQFLKFTLVYNEGGAMGTNLGSSNYYLISSIIILLLVLAYIYANRNETSLTIPLSFISGGAVGNIIDRIQFGYVVDFIDVDFFNIDIMGYQLQRWWTFNLADSFISCSLVFLIFYIFFIKKQDGSSAKATVEETTNK